MSVMGDETNQVRASNVLDDYSYIYLNDIHNMIAILFRCSTGLGPSGSDSNDVIGNISYNNMLLPERVCSGLMRAEGAPRVDRFPGVYHARHCSRLTISTEGVYTCTLKNSSMMNQSLRVGIYFIGRSKPLKFYYD